MQVIDNYGDTQYNGHAVSDWLTQNVDLMVYISALYMAFVFKGPVLVQWIFGGHPPVALMKKLWMVWNIGLAVFSIYGSSRITPLMIRNLSTKGQKETLCVRNEKEIFTGKYGLAMGLFAISKLPEFGDTFFLIFTGKRKLPFLQWSHHVTIFIFSWFAYMEGSSAFVVIAFMNYFVHAIMYTYFALAEAGFKDMVKPFGIYITLLQLSQMVGGLYFTFRTMMYKAEDPAGCQGTSWASLRGQIGIYALNLITFSDMFLNNYVYKKPATDSIKKKGQ